MIFQRALIPLALIAVFSGCGKKGKTKSSDVAEAPASPGRGSPTDFVPSDGSGNTPPGSRLCANPLPGASEASLAGFLGKTLVPQAERETLSAEELKSKYVLTRYGKPFASGVMYLEGDPTYCLSLTGSGATRKAKLVVEYEDHFGISRTTIEDTSPNGLSAECPRDSSGNFTQYCSATYHVVEDATKLEVFWMDNPGFVYIIGDKSAIVDGKVPGALHYANMPSVAALEARSSADKTAAPFADTFQKRTECRRQLTIGGVVWNTQNCVTKKVFDRRLYIPEGADNPFSETVKGRIADIIRSYVITNYSAADKARFLIENGKVGDVAIQ